MPVTSFAALKTELGVNLLAVVPLPLQDVAPLIRVLVNGFATGAAVAVGVGVILDVTVGVGVVVGVDVTVGVEKPLEVSVLILATPFPEIDVLFKLI